MIARYHLGLGALALLLGCVVAVGDRFLLSLRTRTVAVAGLVGAVLGAWESHRRWPWLLLAVALVFFVDDESEPHPLGRAALPLAVLSLAGVWSAVPDTEAALATGAVLLPVAVLRAVRGPVVGPSGTAALLVAISGSVWAGSAGWGAALATMCALGLVAVAPAVMGFDKVLVGGKRSLLVGVHAVVVLVVPRLIMVRSVPTAWGVAALVTAGFVVLATTIEASNGSVDPMR